MVTPTQRTKRALDVVKETIEASPYCKRCGETKHLHVHHVIAIADGGSDDIANCDVLCGECHREWHRIEGNISYGDFLNTTPAKFLLKMQARNQFSDIPLSQIKEAHSIVRDSKIAWAKEKASDQADEA